VTLGLMRQRPGVLPVEVTGFIGRQRELARLGSLLTTARLITVTGPGGVGKTRVTLRAAAQLTDHFADGICLVELSGLRDPELLPDTVAACLGLPERDARPRLDVVLEHLYDRQVLVILDTCEHLLDACAMLADVLLRGTAKVTIVATSRQPLDVPGEHTCSIAPLPVSGPAGGDAIELFTERAAAVVPGFAVTDANRRDVIRLCERLDGMPLAIELATVRLRALSLAQLAERLDDCFSVLTGGRRTALPRHQTLRTAIEWSYDLCSPAERTLWARLSVFAGVFSVTAAEDVCAGGELDRDQIVETIIGLVDKSVLLRVDEDDGTRYRLLDTIREFGAEQLAASGAEAEFRGKHIARYLALAEYLADHFIDDQAAGYHALRSEHADIRAALQYGLALPGERPAAARLATSLYGYWQISGLLREGKRWLTKVLEHFPDPSPERAMTLIVRCYLVNRGRADGEEGIAIAERLGETFLAGRGYVFLHLALTLAGSLDEAAAVAAAATERLTATGDSIGLCCLDMGLGLMHLLAGEPELTLFRCAEGMRRVAVSNGGMADGERWLTSYYHSLGSVALFMQGKYGPSTSVAHQALTAKLGFDDALGTAYCLETLAWNAAAGKRHERASWLFGAAAEQRNVVGHLLPEVFAELHRKAAEATRLALGDERYATFHARGAALTVDQIITHALGDSDKLQVFATGPSGTPRPGALSNREHEIAAMVAEGLSNREIAERLVISKRTVDAHVEHIFSKLGVSSRVQVATWLTSGQPAGALPLIVVIQIG
jgi:predicted ATPase/DNA-binding CsgD family transcriptional regulator